MSVCLKLYNIVYFNNVLNETTLYLTKRSN
jgi:hypothetical protein